MTVYRITGNWETELGAGYAKQNPLCHWDGYRTTPLCQSRNCTVATVEIYTREAGWSMYRKHTAWRTLGKKSRDATTLF